MKKVILLILLVFCISGCTNLNKTDTQTVVNDVESSNLKLSNQYRRGYKYYLATNLDVKKIDDMTEIISDSRYKYYLYVDLISYYNKVKFDYKANSNSYYSQNISTDKKSGYLEINLKNNKYLIEIMYNYAKIEVIVDKDDINEAVANSLIVLSTIKYNDNIIENMMGEDVLTYNEETFSIFDTNGGDSNFLEILQEYDTYEGKDEEDVPDYDLIN